ncbi:Ig-like domain repeat protein, partial [Klebsiella pneumoniae]|uniref:Ig-like domain repeat protein n=1 Tax=Klebsiella pneumoniae TaxID=573 RepID=UPI003EE2436A
ASDASGIDELRASMQRVSTGYYYNGSSFSSSFEMHYITDGSSMTYPFPITEFFDGAYTFRARVRDGAGNTTTSANT